MRKTDLANLTLTGDNEVYDWKRLQKQYNGFLDTGGRKNTGKGKPEPNIA